MPSNRSERERSTLESDSEWRREFDALRESYRTRLSEQIRELESAVDRALSPTGNTHDVEDARGLAHRLTGTAGTYGFAKAGETLRKIEEHLAMVQESRIRGSAIRQPGLLSRLRGIREELALPEPGSHSSESEGSNVV